MLIAKNIGVPAQWIDDNYISACDEPTSEQYASAANNKINSFYSLGSVADIKTALNTHLPVEMGFEAFQSFYDAYTNNRVYTTVGTNDLHTGHAVCIIGYDDSKNAFLIQNSYGNTAGDPDYHGCIWFDYGLFTNPDLHIELYVALPNVPRLTVADFAAGADGNMYAVGTVYNSVDGNSIYQWDNNAYGTWSQMNGQATSVAVDANGTPWVTNTSGNIFQRSSTGPHWLSVSGGASALAFGYNNLGTMYAISNVVANTSGNYIWKRTATGTWIQLSGSAVKIAVDPSDVPWIINKQNQIFKYNGSTWTLMPGSATDIAIGGDGNVYMLGSTLLGTTGYGIYKWTGSSWTQLNGSAVQIAVTNSGTVWVVNALGMIFRLEGEHWIQK